MTLWGEAAADFLTAPTPPPPPRPPRRPAPRTQAPVALIPRELAIQSAARPSLNVSVDARCDEGSHLSPVSRGRHSLTITARGSVDFSLKQWKLAATVEGGEGGRGGGQAEVAGGLF